MAPHIAVGGQNIRVALACYQRAHDPHAGHAGDVGDDVMELEIHLHERLLHVLDMRGSVIQMPFPQAQVAP